MKELFELLQVRLNLFDGDGSGTPAAQGDNTGEEPGTAPGEESAGAETGGQDGKPTDAERRKAYFDLVNGEYKDLYDQEFQKSLDKRMRAKEREAAGLRAKLDASQTVLDTLFARYGITDGDIGKLSVALDQDNEYWAGAAEQAGMSVEQYRNVQKMQLENERFRKAQEFSERQQAMQRQLAKWDEEAAALREEYPEFDLQSEVQNDVFMKLLENGFSVKNAYESAHVGELLGRAAQEAAAKAEKQVTENIRAKGARPPENGTKQSAGFTTKIDVNQTTKQDREELARRAARGERIVL